MQFNLLGNFSKKRMWVWGIGEEGYLHIRFYLLNLGCQLLLCIAYVDVSLQCHKVTVRYAEELCEPERCVCGDFSGGTRRSSSVFALSIIISFLSAVF